MRCMSEKLSLDYQDISHESNTTLPAHTPIRTTKPPRPVAAVNHRLISHPGCDYVYVYDAIVGSLFTLHPKTCHNPTCCGLLIPEDLNGGDPKNLFPSKFTQ